MPKYKLVLGGEGNLDAIVDSIDTLEGLGVGILGEAYLMTGDGSLVIETEDIQEMVANKLRAGVEQKFPGLLRRMEIL